MSVKEWKIITRRRLVLRHFDPILFTHTDEHTVASSVSREDSPSSKRPDPLSDSVRRSDQLLWETTGADQWNQRIHMFHWSAPLVSRSNWWDRRTESDSGSRPCLTQDFQRHEQAYLHVLTTRKCFECSALYFQFTNDRTEERLVTVLFLKIQIYARARAYLDVDLIYWSM